MNRVASYNIAVFADIAASPENGLSSGLTMVGILNERRVELQASE
jgi:hypothetical protein